MSVENITFIQKESWPLAIQGPITKENPRLEDIDRGMQNLVLTLSSAYAHPGWRRQLLYDVADEDAMFQKELEVQSILRASTSNTVGCL